MDSGELVVVVVVIAVVLAVIDGGIRSDAAGPIMVPFSVSFSNLSLSESV